jgi:hypothetical protein
MPFITRGRDCSIFDQGALPPTSTPRVTAVLVTPANHNRPGPIVSRERLGGLRFYHRDAA